MCGNLLVCALLAGCAHRGHASAAEQPPSHADKLQDGRPIARDYFRNTIPIAEPQPPLRLPTPEEVLLDNGLRLWVVPKHDLPLVQVLALIGTGSAQDPKGQEGLASMTASTMRRGTRSRSAQAIALEVEDRGASLSVSVTDDATQWHVGAMTENIGPVLDVLADVLQQPSFARSEFELAQKRRLTQLLQAQSEPPSIAQTVFSKVVYGQHPYGNPGNGDLKSIRAMRAAALAAFYAKHVRPANTHIIVVGDITREQAAQMIVERFGAWRGKKFQDKPPVAPKPQPQEIALVHRADGAQSQLMVGGLGLSRQSPDLYSAMVANAILGGLFNSRLNMNLREDKGWTYGAGSRFAPLRATGPFFVSTSIRKDVTGQGITEIFGEIERMRHEPVSQAELLAAKNSLTLTLPANFETMGGIANMFSTLALHQLPVDYWQKFPEEIDKVTTGDVQRAINTYMAPKALSVVVVGDRAALEPELTALKRGPVRHRDVDGKVLDAPQGQNHPHPR